MVAGGDEGQVVEVVIETVAIDMMHVLPRVEWAAQMLLHHPTVMLHPIGLPFPAADLDGCILAVQPDCADL